MTTMTPERQAVLDRFEADLLSGRHFALIAQSNRSVRPGWAGPTANREWAGAVAALARFAASGDRSAQAAQAVLVNGVPLYQTRFELVAKVAEALAQVVRDGWDDVLGRAAGGRYSAHQHPTDLRSALRLALLMAEVKEAATPENAGVGWALRALIEREGLHVAAHEFPASAKALAA